MVATEANEAMLSNTMGRTIEGSRMADHESLDAAPIKSGQSSRAVARPARSLSEN
jgi:hypothetical protein